MRFLPALSASILLAYVVPATAQEAQFPDLRPAANGTFRIGSIALGLEHKSWNWAPAIQRDAKPSEGYPKETPGQFEFKGKFPTDSGVYDLTQTVRQLADGALGYNAKVTGEPVKDSRFLCLSLLLPVEEYRSQSIYLDEVATPIPWWFKGQFLFPAAKRVKSLRIPLKTGGTLAIEGDFEAMIQDNREYGAAAFDLQIYFNPHVGTIRDASLDVTMRRITAGPQAVTFVPNAKQPPRTPRPAQRPQTFQPDPARIAAALKNVLPVPPIHPQGEDFVDAAGKPIRFWGMNLVSFYPEYDLADKTAANLASLGVNLVRLHHNLRPSFDWSPKDMPALVTYENDSRVPNLKAWDRYDYLNADLRNRGIYLSLSIHGTRQYYPEDVAIQKVSAEDDEAWSEAVDDLNHWHWKKSFDPRKMLPVIDERCFQLSAEFARQMLTHVNPYTGVSYAKDPQVVSVELVNEFSSEYVLLCGNQFPEYWTKRLNARLTEFATARGVPVFTLYGRKTEAQKRCFSDFCNELDQTYARRMEKIIREAGFTGPLEFSNLWRGDAQLRWRATWDNVIEDHAYDDPFVFNEPNKFLYGTSRSAVAGKPLIIGEMNQSEDPAVSAKRKPVVSMLPVATAAYSSLQNYAGIIWFAWAHGTFQLNPDGWGKPGREPSIGLIAGHEDVLAHMRSSGIIYKNRYLSASRDPQTVTVSPEYVPGTYNDLMNGQTVVQPGWQAVHGFRKTFGPSPATQKEAAWLKTTPPAQTLSDTGEILRDVPRRQLSFAAPKTEGFSGFLDGRPAGKANILAVQGAAGFATVVLVSLDDKPLAQSQKLLLSRTWNDGEGKSTPPVPVTLQGLKGTWKMTVTRPGSSAPQTVTAGADGKLSLPGDWRECELQR